MEKLALITFLDKLAQQMGSQMQLCCGRTLGNMPSLPRRESKVRPK